MLSDREVNLSTKEKGNRKTNLIFCGYGLLDSHVALAFPSVSQVKVGNKSNTGSPFLERIWPVLIINLTIGHFTLFVISISSLPKPEITKHVST